MNPSLAAWLESAPAQAVVDVVVVLSSPRPRSLLHDDVTHRFVDDLLKAVSLWGGTLAISKVFSHHHAFYAATDAPTLRHLLTHDHVAFVTLNE